MALPSVDPEIFLPGYRDCPVTLHRLPAGPWSTPLRDLVPLAKLAAAQKPTNILELGSFRGFTALLLAEHTPETTRIVAADVNPSHGTAYRNHPLGVRIERLVGASSADLFSRFGDGSFDFLFIDADHSYSAVKRDTELCLRLVSENGFLLWHDYANWGYFSRTNGVPEYLRELSSSLPIGQIIGCDVAIHRPSWKGTQRPQFESAVAAAKAMLSDDVWATSEDRG
jgi:SAM-dependent methyltransferase